MSTPQNSPGPKWISWENLAAYLEIRVDTVRKSARRHGCRLFKIGGVTKGILAADLDKMYTIVDPEAVEFN